MDVSYPELCESIIGSSDLITGSILPWGGLLKKL